MLFFNAWGIATLICSIFALMVFGYLVTLRNKGIYTRYLALFFLGGFGLDFGYLFSAILPGIESGYHRFITVPSVFLPLIMMIQFAYIFPRNYHKKESRIVLWVTIAISLLLIFDFCWRAAHTKPDFFFLGNYFNYPQEMGKRVAIGILIFTVYFLVMMIRKAIILKGEERRAIIQMMIAMLIPSLIPGTANALFTGERITPGMFQQIFVSATILGYFAITIVFINNTVDRTSFMTKIVGISVVTMLLVIQGLATLVFRHSEENYARIRALETLNYQNTGKLTDDIAYVAVYSPGEETKEPTLEFNRSGTAFDPAVLQKMRDDFESSLKSRRVLSNIARHARPFSTDIYFGYQAIDSTRNRIVEVGYPYMTYRQYVNESAMNIALFTVFVILLVLILYPIFFSRSLVRPLNVLLDGVGEVNLGNLRVKIPVMVQDEIGYLSESFNKMVKSILEAKNQLEHYAETLEEKVEERTREVTQKMEEIQALKVQQDGDYYLTSLIEKPLVTNWNKSTLVTTDFYIDQKKKFSFRNRSSELGGDICITGNLRFGSDAVRHVVFMNGDAMGKSMQGAGGAIVLGTAMNNIMARSAGQDRILNITPAEWLKEAFEELHKLFLTFDGLMMASAVLGVINEQTGRMWFFNAEHPWMAVYRNGKAEFIEKELMLRKLGSPSEFTFLVQEFQLLPGDILIAGSDGRDDVDLSPESDVRRINEDETLFLRHVESASGDLDRIVERVYSTGALTDDFSLMRIGFQTRHLVSDRQDSGFLEVEKYYLEGKQLLESGERHEAVKSLHKALERSPGFADALRLLGQAYFEMKMYDQAAETIENYLEFNPDATNYWFYLSICFKYMKQFDRARDAGEKVREMQPHRIANLLNLADSYRMLGGFEKAREIVNQALKIDPSSEPAIRLDGLLKTRGV